MGYLDSAKKKQKKSKAVTEASTTVPGNFDMGVQRNVNMPIKRAFGRRSGTK